MPIFKIGQRVFRYGKFAYDKEFLNTICSILDLGLKFVPNLFSNEYDFFYNLLHLIDNQSLELNKKFFYSKVNYNNKNKNRINNRARTNVDFTDAIEENIEIDPIDNCIFSLKNLNKSCKKSNADKYPLQLETLIFRSELYKKLTDLNFDLQSNLSLRQLFYLKKYVQGKANFLVLQCDKNIGAMIISKEHYNDLILNYLNENAANYKSLNENPLQNTIVKINDTLKNLYKNKDISLELYKNLKLDNLCRLGSIRLLPKLHKDKFSVRAIINCIGHPTEKLCKLVDSFLKPIVSGLPTVLKDSQDLLQRFDNFKPKNLKKIFLYSCDFESLYTNIDPKDATNKIIHFLKNENLLKSKHLNYRSLKVILSLIFKWNVFKYSSYFFIQCIGLPMGCKCGPTIANIYLYIIEKEWIAIQKPLIYGRFIDDICLGVDHELDCKKFQEHFTYLKLNIVHAEEIAFLDLSISFDILTNRIKTNLYIKPTNTYSYLLTSSNHPVHIFKNIPKSLFIRVRRICTTYIDYVFHAKKLVIQLYLRGYDFNLISNVARAIGKIKRDSLLPYKNKKNDIINKSNTLLTYYKFDSSLSFFKNTINEAFQITKEFLKKEQHINSNFIQNFKLKSLFCIGNSIGSSLIHGHKNKKMIKIFKNFKCNLTGCNTCPYVVEDNKIKINDFLFPFKKSSSCVSSGVIYLISCKKCNQHYIGETERTANDRLSEHIYKINSFKYDLTRSLANLDNLSEVAIHFNKQGHTLNDLAFNILNKDIKNIAERKSLETDLIHLFTFLKIKILNKKKPKMKYIKKFFFS